MCSDTKNSLPFLSPSLGIRERENKQKRNPVKYLLTLKWPVSSYFTVKARGLHRRNITKIPLSVLSWLISFVRFLDISLGEIRSWCKHTHESRYSGPALVHDLFLSPNTRLLPQIASVPYPSLLSHRFQLSETVSYIVRKLVLEGRRRGGSFFRCEILTLMRSWWY